MSIDTSAFGQAPSEAEAQCAALAREGVVYGTATEDMDALTFQTPKLLRRMTFSGSQQPILEVDYTKLLQVLKVIVTRICSFVEMMQIHVVLLNDVTFDSCRG